MMKNGKKFLCVIPARGGSTRLKGKNIKLFCGKPLIGWVIDAARDSGVFDKIVVSTDSELIKEVAEDYKVTIQNRPKELATDTALVQDVMQYVVTNLPKTYDYVQLLEPTAPMVDGPDILRAVKFTLQKDADFVTSVCPLQEQDIPLGFASPIPESKLLTDWFPKGFRYVRTQDVGRSYHLDGNIYIGKDWVWREKKDYWDTKIYAYVMPANKFCHIDTEEDFVWAETIMRMSWK